MWLTAKIKYYFYTTQDAMCTKIKKNDKVQLQNWLQSQATNSLNKINITTYFENLTIKLHVLYALNTHINFCVNQIFFTI